MPRSKETKVETATVSGRITLKGEPARGVMVILHRQNHYQLNSPRARTDERGRFRFTGVAGGRYSVYALAPGYTEASSHGSHGRMLSIIEDEEIDNVDLELKRGGVITGRVTDSQGRPVIEETIGLIMLNLNNFPVSQNFEMYRTDDRGVYRIYGLPEGRYLVSVGDAQTSHSPGVISGRVFYPRVFYPNASSESQARVIEVNDGSVAADIDITVPDPKMTRVVSGVVVDAGTGQPVAGVEVVVGLISDDGRPTEGLGDDRVWSGPEGEFSLYGVLPGKYVLFVPANRGIEFVSDRVIFDISEGDAHGLELKVRPVASISGVVVIEGTNDPNVLAILSQVSVGASVNLAEPNSQSPVEIGRVMVKGDGSFRLSGLPAGKTKITTFLPKDFKALFENKLMISRN
ncbi:MAG: carboxypeptidase regulatory-like domain-containing protein [Acidobacteria bacterium]|nr:carboxypeptidase regulatory-like domain-containing protein [Acidobacteriota bacterium]